MESYYENPIMSDAFEQQDWMKFGVAATLGRQYAQDERQFLARLATMLEGALPGEVEVTRRGGLFAKKTVQSVAVSPGENRYTLTDAGHGPLQATRTRVVRGIALKTETVSVAEWLQEVGAILDERVRASAQAREALERLVG